VKNLKEKTDLYVKACIYGPSGTGKTSLGVTAPKPLILLSEAQGQLHIKQAAQRLGIDEPDALYMEGLDDYRCVLRALHGDRSKPFIVKDTAGKTVHEGEWPETTVIDSLTDAARLIVKEIREISPPKAGKDGLPVDAQRFWNTLQDRMQNLILAFRNAPTHVLFLCLADDRMTGPDDAQTRSVTPDLPMRKLANFVAAACNVMGYSYRSEQRKGNQVRTGFGVLLSGPEGFLLKGCAPLRSKERANFTAFVEGILNGVNPTGDVVPSQEHLEPNTETDNTETEKEKTDA
jgi:hypothetical protein